MTFIERNIPPPKARPTAVKFPWGEMQHGDSFVTINVASAKASFRSWRSRYKGPCKWVIRVKKQKSGAHRVWLIDDDIF